MYADNAGKKRRKLCIRAPLARRTGEAPIRTTAPLRRNAGLLRAMALLLALAVRPLPRCVAFVPLRIRLEVALRRKPDFLAGLLVDEAHSPASGHQLTLPGVTTYLHAEQIRRNAQRLRLPFRARLRLRARPAAARVAAHSRSELTVNSSGELTVNFSTPRGRAEASTELTVNSSEPLTVISASASGQVISFIRAIHRVSVVVISCCSCGRGHHLRQWLAEERREHAGEFVPHPGQRSALPRL